MNKILFFFAMLFLAGLIYASTDITIPQTFTAFLNSTGGAGGVAPYTYNWFSKCPSCGTFNVISGANQLVYYFTTNTQTATGRWEFLIQGADSAGNVVNSATVNVIVVPILNISGEIYYNTGNGLTQATTSLSNYNVISVNAVAGGNVFFTNNQINSFNSGGGGVTSINGATGAVTIVGQNGIYNSISGSQITLGINSILPITNTLNGIGCNSCSGTTYTAGTGLQLVGNQFSLLPLTAGSGIAITNTNTVTNLGVLGIDGSGGTFNSAYNGVITLYSALYSAINGIYITPSNQIGIDVTAPITNTLGTIGCTSCSGKTYSAGTGLTLSGNTFSLTPLTGTNGIQITNTNNIGIATLAPLSNTMNAISLSTNSNYFGLDGSNALTSELTFNAPIFAAGAGKNSISLLFGSGLALSGNTLVATGASFAFGNGLAYNSITNTLSVATFKPLTNNSLGIGCIGCTGGGGTSLLMLPNLANSQYAGAAQVLFSIGVLLTILLILLTFRVYDFHRKNHRYTLADGIIGLAIGFIAIICILFGLFYTTTVATPAYNITTAAGNYLVANEVATSVTLASNQSFGSYGYAFIFIDIILALVYLFMAMLVYGRERRKRRFED